MKVQDFKRGSEIPNGSRYISSRRFIKTEDYDGGHPQEWDTRIVEDYWIDTYEVFTEKSLINSGVLNDNTK